MKRLAILGVVGVLLGGCAGNTKWFKAGASREEFQLDKYECKVTARQSANFGDVYNPAEDIAAFRECMNSRGWEARRR